MTTVSNKIYSHCLAIADATWPRHITWVKSRKIWPSCNKIWPRELLTQAHTRLGRFEQRIDPQWTMRTSMTVTEFELSDEVISPSNLNHFNHDTASKRIKLKEKKFSLITKFRTLRAREGNSVIHPLWMNINKYCQFGFSGNHQQEPSITVHA